MNLSPSRVNTSAAIDIQDLSLRYGSGANALQGVTFSVRSGEICGLLGPNGSGKTSLFRVITTLLSPTSGTVLVFGEDVRFSPYKVRRFSGVVFQSQSLDRKLKVRENLLHQGHLFGWQGIALSKRISEVIEIFGLSNRAEDIVETLSGGLKRRVELAKAMLHQPRMLLLDEPSTGLDPGARRDFWQHLEILNQQGTTILLTTHLMDEAERCHRTAILCDGKLIALDTPARIRGHVGGDVIVLRSSNPETLGHAITARFGLKTVTLLGSLRIEQQNGHELAAQLANAFPGQIEAITISKPSLEDAFIHMTGRTFWTEKDSVAAETPSAGVTRN